MDNFFNFNDQWMTSLNLNSNNKNNTNDLYNPYEGFIRGNLYKNLYDSYKIEKPYEIKLMNEQAAMLTDIDALCFACIDLNLYLDVFPNDKQIIDLYNKYNLRKNELTKEYENKFGPLLLSSESLNKYPWAWNNLPWPWNEN